MFLPMILLTYANYSDPWARNYMLPLASGAYSEDPQGCLTNTFGDGNVAFLLLLVNTNFQLKRLVKVKCDAVISDDCAGYTASIPSKNAIVVAFRGTNRFFQLVEEGTKSVFKDKVGLVHPKTY